MRCIDCIKYNHCAEKENDAGCESNNYVNKVIKSNRWFECKCDACVDSFSVMTNNGKVQICRDDEKADGCIWRGEIITL